MTERQMVRYSIGSVSLENPYTANVNSLWAPWEKTDKKRLKGDVNWLPALRLTNSLPQRQAACSFMACIPYLCPSFSGITYDIAFLVHDLDPTHGLQTSGSNHVHPTELGCGHKEGNRDECGSREETCFRGSRFFLWWVCFADPWVVTWHIRGQLSPGLWSRGQNCWPLSLGSWLQPSPRSWHPWRDSQKNPGAFEICLPSLLKLAWPSFYNIISQILPLT